jgi:hypothetical protein
VNEFPDIPLGDAGPRCVERQALIFVPSAPARARSRTTICEAGNIHSDGVSWVCSCVTCIDLGSLACRGVPAHGSEPPLSPWLQSLNCSLRWLAGHSG